MEPSLASRQPDNIKPCTISVAQTQATDRVHRPHLIDVNGTLYGTTSSGGEYGSGTVFGVTTSGMETVIHSFSGSDGSEPLAALKNVEVCCTVRPLWAA